MNPAKRLFDIILASILLIVLAPVLCVVAIAILLVDGAPVFYFSERMKTVNEGFVLWKFRTMAASGQRCGVSSGHTRHRISPLGAWLRLRRLDELPQLVNVLRGDMSFVGPPPLRRYVESFPDLYDSVLRNRPGVTGLATLVYHRTEERLLQDCHSAECAERIYLRRCVPIKARLDLIWAQHQSFRFDLLLILKTAMRPLRPDRPCRIRKPRTVRKTHGWSASLAIIHTALPDMK